MLQRIQSIWLLLAAIFAAITFRFPFYTGEHIVDVATNTSAHFELNANGTIWLTLATVLTGAIAFVTIFLFDNRKLQLKLCYLGIFLTIVVLTLYFLEIPNFVANTGTFALSWVLAFWVVGVLIFAGSGFW